MDHIKSFEELVNNGFKFNPPRPPTPTTTTANKSESGSEVQCLPPLKNPEALEDVAFVTYLPDLAQAGDTSQMLKKIFTTQDKSVDEPVFLYIMYYAEVEKKTKNDEDLKRIFIWPVRPDNENSSRRRILSSELRGAVVQLDFSKCNPEEKKIEIGVRGFQKGDYFVIQKLGVTFGVERIDINEIFGYTPLLVVGAGDPAAGSVGGVGSGGDAVDTAGLNPEAVVIQQHASPAALRAQESRVSTFRNCMRSIANFFCCSCGGSSNKREGYVVFPDPS